MKSIKCGGIITGAEADRIWAQCDAEEAQRAADMPTEKDALNAMFRAWQRLKTLGWKEAVYCPKDGSTFKVIEAGSTGTFYCHYEGKWPTGGWWIHDDGDLWPSRPILFKPTDAALSAQRAEAKP